MCTIQLAIPTSRNKCLAIAKTLGSVSDNEVVAQFTETELIPVPPGNRLMVIERVT